MNRDIDSRQVVGFNEHSEGLLLMMGDVPSAGGTGAGVVRGAGTLRLADLGQISK